ncbi:unnamed protein product [Cercopithifilaria johnstoni]|uniref:Uncharacterized protein n=1 Tax=Cercopithifilaria johnstoni TaxID=2874296 RepID=A0A8J2Q2P5_9BILA|nr:unnamed protein product [Cercopithifilaria johnstoni]
MACCLLAVVMVGSDWGILLPGLDRIEMLESLFRGSRNDALGLGGRGGKGKGDKGEEDEDDEKKQEELSNGLV